MEQLVGQQQVAEQDRKDVAKGQSTSIDVNNIVKSM